MSRRRGACLASLAALFSAQAAAFGHFPLPEVVRARQAVLAEPASAAGEPALAARLALAQALAPADALHQELQLHRLLLELRTLEPGEATRAAVAALATYEPQAWTEAEDPDHARGRAVPVADVAAAARGTLRHWQLRERIANYSDALAHAREIDAPVDGEALAAALAHVPPNALGALAPPRDWPGSALAALAQRTADAENYHRLFRAAPEPASYAALAEAARALAPADAAAVLIEATANPALASAAVLALAPLVEQRGVRAFLLAQLGDPALGGSAAQVLWAQPDAATRVALQGLLERGQDSPALRRALLVLQHIDDPAARASLRAFADDARYAPALRARIARSLP
ncbi:MAG TPA: hypothetical protein VM074_08610 [Solimonas sp.]|nr:hypothetical protein [Solimonas sp.]